MAKTKRGRRGNGEGSIYRRKDGRYVGQYTTPTMGKRRYVYGKTRAEAAQKMREAMAALEAGAIYDSKRTVSEFFKGYLADVGGRVREKTLRRYQDLLDVHLLPGLGDARLVRLAPEDLRALYRRRLALGYSARTVGHLHALVKQALSQAVLEGIVPRNAAEAVKPPKAPAPEFRPLDTEEVARLLTAAHGSPYEALYVLAVTAGLRRGELLGLMWDDVDFAGGTLQVRRTLQKGQLLPPKTPKSRRRIKLTRRALDALRGHRERQEAARAACARGRAEMRLVFPNRVGNPTCGDNLYSRHFRPLLKRAGLPPIRFHDLRHSCATLLLTKGVHPKVVSEMLGHATISITLDTYSHVMPGLGDAAASAMDDALAFPSE